MNEKQAAVNSQIISALERGEIKQAQDATTSYTRTGILEKSFLGEILPKETVTDADLLPTMDKSLAVMYEKQPQSAGAKWVPFQTAPEGKYIETSKYIVPAAKVITDELEVDLDELRTTKMPIQKVMSDLMINKAVESIDGKFIGLINQILNDSDTAGIQKNTGKRQLISFADGINRSTWADAKTLMYRGSTFSGMKGMYRLRTSCALMNEATAQQWTKLNFFEYGGEGAQKNLEEGLTRDKMGGVRCVYTMKDDIIPDDWVYFFAAPEFLGHYYEIRGWTTFMEQRATVIKMHSHWLGGCGIGNVAGVTLARFNQG
jgi:hypothetical protein